MSKNKKNIRREVIYGVHPIIELLKSKKRKLLSLYTTKPLPKSWNKIKPFLPKSIANIQYVSRDKLAGIAGSPEHMGVVALTTPFQYQNKVFDPNKKPFILLLDSIQDVGNLGAILRSAYCTGIDGIVLCQKGGTMLTPAVFKASAGYAEHLDIYVAPTINVAVNELKRVGYNLYLSVIDSKNDATKINYKKPVCLVIGNESTGITGSIKKDGQLITLPQKAADISYNASVAAGILLFVVSQKIK
ncbi:MAG: RNA methyltransferase [bacterium]